MWRLIGIIALFYGLTTLSFKEFYFLKALDNLASNWRIQLRSDSQAPPDDSLLFVGVDEPSLKFFGSWPWPRSTHAALMQALLMNPPSVLAWDILFVERSNLNPEEDAALVEGVNSIDYPMVLASKIDRDELETEALRVGVSRPIKNVEGDVSRLFSMSNALLPIEELRANSYFGFVDVVPHSDGVVREVPLVVRFQDYVFANISLQVVLRHWKVSEDEVKVVLGEAVYVTTAEGERSIPIDDRGFFKINYRYESQAWDEVGDEFVNVDYSDFFLAVQGAGEGPTSADKIIFVGMLAEGLVDIGPSPLNNESPRVLTHMNTVDNILKGDYLDIAPLTMVMFFMGMVTLAVRFVLGKQQIIYDVVVLIGVVVVYLFISQWMFEVHNYLLPLFPPMLAFVGTEVYFVGLRLKKEMKRQSEIKGMFSTYVSPEVVNQMIDADEKPKLGGEKSDITALFSDVEGFSGFSEVLPPEGLVDLMNEYLSVMTDVIQDHQGTLDKYIGDAIVAMYGAPIRLENHASKACHAVVEMQKKQGELCKRLEKDSPGLPAMIYHMRTRVGLNSGDAIVGNMGSRTRFNYTMMGDTVNVAARCESGAKSYGVYSMVTEQTFKLAKEQGGDTCVFRLLDRIIVKGRVEPVSMYELIGLKEDVGESELECIGLFEEGLRSYFEQDWDASLDYFERAEKLEMFRPGLDAGIVINPSLMFLDRVRKMKSKPPGDDWNGVFVMTTK